MQYKWPSEGKTLGTPGIDDAIEIYPVVLYDITVSSCGNQTSECDISLSLSLAHPAVSPIFTLF